MISEIDKKTIDLALAAINKEYGKNTITRGDATPVEVEVVSTGNFKLDIALQVGGLPKGRIVEIYGAEGLGKSLIASCCIAECQMAGGVAAYVDVEQAIDPTWLTHLGVDMEELVISQPEWGEQALDIVEHLVKTNVFDVIVVDSVAALAPKAELEGEMEDQHIGLQPRLMAHALRKINPYLKASGTCLIFINQIRDKIGYMQQGTTSPGGRALKFWASVRLELKSIGEIKDKKTNEILGTRVKVMVKKNKVGSPGKSVEYDVLHGVGFNNFGSILELAERFGLIIKKGGGYYYLPGEEKSFAHGEDAAIGYLASDLEFTNNLKAEIINNVRR